MRVRLQIFLAMSILSVGLLAVFTAGVSAQEEVPTTPDDSAAVVAADATETQDWKQEISSDRQQIKQQRDEIKANAQAAIQGEKDLRDQIHQAVQSGDHETAESLKEQLKTTHQENLGQKKQDLQGLKDARHDLRSDKKEFRTEKMDNNNDGTVDDAEQQAFKERIQKFDKDNNPPGAAGGAGTNWENKPGPQGGPGTSSDRRYYDRDNNPPGAAGGQGTNWENRPGPQGGPGTSSDRRQYDRDNNPPGAAGGAGTNWENRPGPQGGPGGPQGGGQGPGPNQGQQPPGGDQGTVEGEFREV